MTWQKIETAPKDRQIMLYSEDGIASGKWDEHDGWIADLANYYTNYVEATHWQPMLDAPKSEDEPV